MFWADGLPPGAIKVAAPELAPPGKLALLVQLGGGIMAVVILSLYLSFL